VSNRLVPSRVRVRRVDFDHRESHGRLGTSRDDERVTTDEVTLVRRDEAIETGHRGRVLVRKLERPHAIAFLEPQAVLRAHADRPEPARRPRFEQSLPERSLVRGRDVDFVAELSGQRHARDHRRRETQVCRCATQERQGRVADITSHQVTEDFT
jgi:hypothetical protein